MHGTREALCTELARMFTHDEPLALLVWTEEGIHSACRELRPTDEEITALLETVGNSDMKVYRREGVTDASVCDLLTRHREAVNRQVMVPAQVLSRLVHDAERELVHQEGLAWEAGGAYSSGYGGCGGAESAAGSVRGGRGETSGIVIRMSRGRSAFPAHPPRRSGFAVSCVPCGLRQTPCLYYSRAAADTREA